MKYPTPREDRAIILLDEIKEEKKGGRGSVFIPDELKEKPRSGTVKAIGKGFYAKETGVFVPTECKEGQRVLIKNNSGERINIEGIEHIMVFEKDITCII